MSNSAPVVDIGTSPGSTVVVLHSGQRHRVNQGETLYAIAWMYNMNFQELARANNIPPPYLIEPGQMLSLDISQSGPSGPAVAPGSQPVLAGGSAGAGQRPAAIPFPQPMVRGPVPDDSRTAHTTTTPLAADSAILRWSWPARGPILTPFSTGTNENKGINIAGNIGDPVFAAEAGEVVYAGSALLRYGDMIIIKHNEKFLSAYAHNSRLDVAEGDFVSRGQQIAALGSTGIDRAMLHFEIRLDGLPVNPLDYLPPR